MNFTTPITGIFSRAIMAFCLILLAVSTTSGLDLATVFPELKSWKQSPPKKYTAETLYEYIDGAAESYLSYDFVELMSRVYDGDKGSSITIDVYHHKDSRNAFGIYSQEKPLEGTFLPIGGQAYVEKGLLNFVQGIYYVKIMGFGLGDKERPTLETIARDIAARLPKESLPRALRCFPEEGKVANSERFINKNFLGHRFLSAAYVADYRKDVKNYQLFLIETADSRAVAEILKNYRALLTEKKAPLKEEGDALLRFVDPFHQSEGLITLRWRGKYLWGVIGDDEALADAAGRKLTERLVAEGLFF